MVWFISHMLAAFMDFGVGILIAVLLWRVVYKTQPSFEVVCLGGFLALVPDFDIVAPILMQGSFVDHHQLPTHFPLFMVPTVAGALWVVNGRLATLAAPCLLWHFVHDSPPLGGGIAWLWPYSTDYWWFGWHTMSGIFGNHVDFMRSWDTPSWFALRELIVGSVALGVATVILGTRDLSLRYPLLLAFTNIGVWGCAMHLWSYQAIIALR